MRIEIQNKYIYAAIAFSAIVSIASGISEYTFSCDDCFISGNATTNMSHSSLTGLSWSESGHIMDTNIIEYLDDFRITNEQSYIGLSNSSGFSSFYGQSLISPYVSTFSISTEGNSFSYTDGVVSSDYSMTSGGFSMYDSTKVDGYACWNAGYLISSPSPCV